MRYDYKVVPAPDRGEKTKGVKGPEGRFAAAIERIMNDMAERGWEYLRTDTLPSEERAGLTQTVTVWRNLLIFRRPNASDVASFEPRLLSPPLVLDKPVVAGRVPEEAEAARTAAALSPRRVERREAVAQAAAAAAKVEAAAAAEPARRVISDPTEALADRLDARLRGVPVKAQAPQTAPAEAVDPELLERAEDSFWDVHGPAEQLDAAMDAPMVDAPAETAAQDSAEPFAYSTTDADMDADEEEQLWPAEDRLAEIAEAEAALDTVSDAPLDDLATDQPEIALASAEGFDPFEVSAEAEMDADVIHTADVEAEEHLVAEVEVEAEIEVELEAATELDHEAQVEATAELDQEAETEVAAQSEAETEVASEDAAQDVPLLLTAEAETDEAPNDDEPTDLLEDAVEEQLYPQEPVVAQRAEVSEDTTDTTPAEDVQDTASDLDDDINSLILARASEQVSTEAPAEDAGAQLSAEADAEAAANNEAPKLPDLSMDQILAALSAIETPQQALDPVEDAAADTAQEEPQEDPLAVLDELTAEAAQDDLPAEMAQDETDPEAQPLETAEQPAKPAPQDRDILDDAATLPLRALVNAHRETLTAAPASEEVAQTQAADAPAPAAPAKTEVADAPEPQALPRTQLVAEAAAPKPAKRLFGAAEAEQAATDETDTLELARQRRRALKLRRKAQARAQAEAMTKDPVPQAPAVKPARVVQVGENRIVSRRPVNSILARENDGDNGVEDTGNLHSLPGALTARAARLKSAAGQN